MNTQELKEYIGRVLGNNIRCLLPSYWWKRLFGLVIDKVDEVEGGIQKVEEKIPEIITSSLAEFAEKYPDIESRTFYHTTNAESEGAQKNLALYEKIVAELGNIVKPVYISYYMYSIFPTIVAQWGILGVEDGELIRFYNIPTAPQGRKYMVDMVLMADGTIETRDNYFLAKGDLELDEYSDTPIANSTVSKEFYRSARAIRIANSDSFVLKDNAKIYYSIRNAEPYRPIVITKSSTTYLATYRESTGNEDGDPIRFIGITYNYSYGEYDLRYIQILLNADGTVTEENSGTLETNAEIPDISNLATKSELESKYTKPSSGIPKSDLVSEVQESLGKADTAIQNVKTINGESILGEGDIEIKANVDTSNLATKEELESLTNEMIANEEVTAAALNELNERVNEISENVSGSTVTKEEFKDAIDTLQKEVIDNEEVVAAALNDLDVRVKEVSANVSGETATKVELQDAVTSLTNTILENEEVHAAALNDLNTRLNEILTRLNNAGL